MNNRKSYFKKAVSGILSMMMLMTAICPMAVTAAETSGNDYPDISEVADYLEDEEIVTVRDIEVEAGNAADIEKEGIAYDAEKVSVKLYEVKDNNGSAYKNDVPGTYRAVYHCMPKSGHPSFSVKRYITVKEPVSAEKQDGSSKTESGGGQEEKDEGSDSDDADSDDQHTEPVTEEAAPSDDQTSDVEIVDEEASAEEAVEETEEVMEEAEEEVDEEMELLNELPTALGTVVVGRESRTPLPLGSSYVPWTRNWYVIHNGEKYWAVCARASASGPVDPKAPDSTTMSVAYHQLDKNIINSLAEWYKYWENDTTVPITKELGGNWPIAKAAMISMFLRDEIWESTFDSFSLSYTAAHLLISNLLFGDDDACDKSDPMYDVIFNQMKSKVETWMQDPDNAALMDVIPAYIAYRSDWAGRQPLMWAEPPGVMELKKQAIDSFGTKIEEYDYTGTVYTVYTDKNCTSQATDVYGNPAAFVCNADGTANKLALNMGTYYIKETAAAEGLMLDSEVYPATLKRTTGFGDNINYVMNEMTDTHIPPRKFGSLEIQKVDADTITAQGGATLEGAVYEVIVNSEDGVTDANNEHLEKGDVLATLVTDSAGKASVEKVPAGDYIIKEKTPSKGYLRSTEEIAISVKDNETTSLTGERSLKEVAIPYTLGFIKHNSNAEAMANVEFELKCKENGKTWTVKTNDKGYGSLEKIPYGTYILTEKECDANRGFTLADPVEFSTKNAGNSTVIDLGIIVNRKTPTIGTVLTAEDGTHNIKPQKNQKLIDTVTYSDMIDYVGKAVTFKGHLMDKETGKEFLVGGKPVTAETTVTLKAPKGQVEVEFTFDASAAGGRALVAFESALDVNGEVIAKHEDKNDRDQTVWAPSIETDAKAEKTGDNVMPASGSDIIDTVTYHALNAGEKYTLKAGLYDADTKESTGIIGEAAFTADSSGNGSVDVTLKRPEGYDVKGKTLVVVETLYDKDNKVVAEHKDLTDERQTVHGPTVKTNATDKVTGSHVGTVSKTTTLVDRVTYTNLVIGKEYTVSGSLHNKATGKEILVGGKPVTAEKTFVADKADGSIELEFVFDSSLLAGQSVIAFERLMHEGIEVAAHADLNDKNQTVGYPSIKTTAVDKTTGTHKGSTEDKKTVIVDTVLMENLVAGLKYSTKAVLMDKAANAPLAGGAYTKSIEFTAEAASQTINVEFEVETAHVIGKSVVAFETLYYNNKEIAVHADINDMDQTVEYPSVETSATDSDTHDHVGAAISGRVHFEDRVDYTGLVPGKEYTLEGVVYDKETEEPLKDADGELIKTVKVFKAEAASGYVILTFEADASILCGKTIVPFETILDGERKIAVHADINDKNQTIYYPEIGTTASDDMTEDNVGTSDRETATLNDKVTYKSLMPGKPYTVKGKLVIKETGETFVVNGSEVTAEKTFTPDKSEGFITLSFTYDASALKGKTVVAFETLYYDGKEVAAHADLEDEGQSVTYPEICTNANDVTTKDHVGVIPSILALKPVMMTQVTDVVTCRGLIPGKEYNISGVLMNKRTSKPFLDEDGKQITASKKFTAKTANDKVELLFEVKSDLLKGETVVAFEDLYYKDVIVATHSDITDKDQSVSYPEIKTSAKDAKTNDHTGTVEEESTVIDVISMSGLVKGQEYKVKGSLRRQDSGEAIVLKDGSEEIEMTFTAGGEKDSVEMTFVFDSSILNGKAVTVFEDLYHNDIKVAVHHDLEDKNQTVYYPEIETDAEDIETEDHSGVVAEQTTVVDKVTCHDLIEGYAYRADGVLMIVPESDDEEATPLLDSDGNPVTSSVSFAVIDGKAVVNASAVTGGDTDPVVIDELTVDLSFTFDSSLRIGKTVVAFETLYHNDITVAVHADIHDERQSVHYPEIGTTAADGETKSNIGTVTETAVLNDTVNYRNLVPGKEYEVKGRLVIKSTGEETGIVSSAKFVPEEVNGSVIVTFTFDSTGFAGDALVAFESLYHNDVELAVHADIEDEEQTVYYPEISTDAEDEATGSSVGLVREDCTIIDTVKYSDLVPGKEYESVATVYVKDTEEPLLDAEGNEITNTVVFTPEEASGEVKVAITFDASLLAGKTVVCFEDLRYEEITIAVHHDINDTEQSVFFPEVYTHATDDMTGTQTGAVTENASVTDVIEYKNLVPGSYIACGSIVDVETGEIAVDADGNEIVARALFANAEMDGTVPVTFTFNAKGFDAKTVVVFQSIYKGSEEDIDGKGVLVAEHNDIEDGAEMIFYPGIETDAKDGMTENHTGRVAEETTVIDVATYKNLIPSTEEEPREYTMKGVLMVKGTGNPLLDKDGNEITAEQTFSPEAADGSVELTFTFDSSLLAGETVVAFERLYENDIEVAAHTDIEDERQSVHYPKIGTKASVSGKKTTQASGTIKLDDEVEYKNLVPGTEYTLVGVLMDKNTGKVLKVGGKDVTSKIAFTPETADGKTTVTFTFNASGLGGKTLVAFEYLYTNDKQVACHAEINDEAQTVKLTPPPSTKTGDDNGMFVWAAAAIIALAGAGVIVFVRKKKN